MVLLLVLVVVVVCMIISSRTAVTCFIVLVLMLHPFSLQYSYLGQLLVCINALYKRLCCMTDKH